jgi:hypothetical protein
MGEVDSKVELQPWDWLAKVTERLTFIRLKVMDHKEIDENDYDLLRVFYGVYWRGEYPIYQTQAVGTVETSVQTGLFADNVADNTAQSTDGTEVVSIEANQNNDNNE